MIPKGNSHKAFCNRALKCIWFQQLLKLDNPRQMTTHPVKGQEGFYEFILPTGRQSKALKP